MRAAPIPSLSNPRIPIGDPSSDRFGLDESVTYGYGFPEASATTFSITLCRP